ncbi:MAG TPA: NUDIX domain-containing protein [Pseudonocardiaceae bacterium]
MADPRPTAMPEPGRRWTIHTERLIDESRYLRVSIADIELPDGARFEKYVFRLPRAAITVLLDDAAQRVLMIWRHRVVPDSWSWELPGGYVDPDEDPHAAAAREVEEETGWRPGTVRLLTTFQPLAGVADFENLVFLAGGAEYIGAPSDPNEAARVEWIDLDSIPDLIARGEISGAGTQIGLLHILAFRTRQDL